MKWYKYKQGTSAHIDKDWNFILVPDWVGGKKQESLEDYLDHLGLLCTYSEHYRGIKYKRVYRAPQKVIEKEIEEVHAKINDQECILDELYQMQEKK